MLKETKKAFAFRVFRVPLNVLVYANTLDEAAELAWDNVACADGVSFDGVRQATSRDYEMWYDEVIGER